MLKFLRNKLQSLTETQLNILTAVLVLINIGIIIFWINFWISLSKPALPKIEEKPPVSEEEIPPEVLQKMSAPPEGETEEVPEEILEKLSAPKKSK